MKNHWFLLFSFYTKSERLQLALRWLFEEQIQSWEFVFVWPIFHLADGLNLALSIRVILISSFTFFFFFENEHFEILLT